MADTKISALAAASALGGTEEIPGVQSAGNVKITPAQIKTYTSASPTLVTPALGVATATSIAIGGATLGSNALAVTGTTALAATALVGHLTFTDNSFDIGASGATRPRTAYVATSIRTPLVAPESGNLSVGLTNQSVLFGATTGGNCHVQLSNAFLIMRSGMGLAFSASSSDASTGYDTSLWRDNAAGIVGIRKDTTAHELRVYNTWSSSTSGEYAGLDWKTTANVARLRVAALASGTVRNLAIDGYTMSGAPSATQLPASTWGLFKDSGGGGVVLAYNDAGSIKTVALS